MIPNDVLRDLEEQWRSLADDAKQHAASLSEEGQAKAAAQELGRASAYNACAMMLHRLIHASEQEAEWSTGLPLLPGYYWRRMTAKVPAMIREAQPREVLVHVTRDENGMLWYGDKSLDYMRAYDPNFAKYEWSGPVTRTPLKKYLHAAAQEESEAAC